MTKIKKSRWKTLTIVLMVFPVFLSVAIWALQTKWSHRKEIFSPLYEKEVLTGETDYQTFWLQTGLGKPAVDYLLATGDLQGIKNVQQAFFSEDHVECKPVFGFLVRSDRIKKEESAPLVDLQAGDILLSFSTHSVGWTHGHAGLVLSENEVLECTSVGRNSRIVKPSHWRKYSNYLVLRVKGVKRDVQEQVATYARENLRDVPYRLMAGIFGAKAMDVSESYFGLQCAYLVWYAWQVAGYDLDADGGKLVTPKDILQSEFLEIIQVYGINPKELD